MNTNFIFGDYSGKLLNLMIKYSNLNDFIAVFLFFYIKINYTISIRKFAIYYKVKFSQVIME